MKLYGILLRFFVCLGAIWGFPAMAADQNPPAKAAPKTSIFTPAASPFYFFAHGGVGFSAEKSELTISGVEVSGTTPKQWPTGFMAGGGLGIGANTQFGYIGGEVEADYDFTRASIGCAPTIPCMGYAKNSWFFAEKLFWSPYPTPASLVGALPGSAQPAHWPIPITTAPSWTSSVMFLPEIGIAQRSVDACMLQLDGSTPCDTKWMNGLLAGLQVRVPLSGKADLRLEYNYIWYNQAITHSDSPVFTNTFKALDEQRLMVGFNYHF